MMDKVAALITRASDLRRAIFASLPFEVRLAEVFTRLSLDTIETLGRVIGAAFIELGVTDMPDPGPHWKPGPKGPTSLPAGYMREFARKVYSKLISKCQDPALVDDVIQNLLIKLTKGKMGIDPGISRSQAESYVFRGAMLEGMNVVRERRNRGGEITDSLDDQGVTEEGEGRAMIDEVSDPNALQPFKRFNGDILPHSLDHLRNEMPSHEWRAWMTYLDREIHPAISQFIELSMEGYDVTTIVGVPCPEGSPPSCKPKPSMLDLFKPKTRGEATSFIKYKIKRIPDVSRKFFRSLGKENFISV